MLKDPPLPDATRSSQPKQLSLTESILASAHCVQAVIAGQSLSDCLVRTDPALRPSVQAISFYVMRQLGFARAVRNQLVKRPPAEPLLDALLLVALALLEAALQVSESEDSTAHRRDRPVYAVHTVVDQSVNATRGKLKPYRGLINGTLRNFIRQRQKLLPLLAENDEARWNYPNWWIKEVKAAWPQQWQQVLEAGNWPGPMTLRVNRRQTTVSALIAAFEAADITAYPLQDYAVVLAEPQPVHSLPGFHEGWWSVQDVAAQRAGTLLPLCDGMRVLDACAAPGGKTAHTLERADVTLLALDSDPSRLQRVTQNLERLQLAGSHVSSRCADASDLSAWWDGKPFDAILADVPCTASGVVRRHPDIRWLRRRSDIKRTAALQRRIIDALWTTLRPGGSMLYVTCSIFPQEGEQQAISFSQRHSDATRLPAPGQVLPLQQATRLDKGDGFYYALFAKTMSGEINSD